LPIHIYDLGTILHNSVLYRPLKLSFHDHSCPVFYHFGHIDLRNLSVSCTFSRSHASPFHSTCILSCSLIEQASRLVFIGKGLDREGLESGFTACLR
jgi:hypothetical protein